MRWLDDKPYSKDLLEDLDIQSFPLTHSMCNKNDYTDCIIRKLRSQEVSYPLATVIFKEEPDKKIHIYSLEVHEKYRLTNIGRRMLTKFMENANIVELSCLPETKIFYEKRGFQELEEKLQIPKEIVEDIEEIKNGVINIGGKYFIFAENKKNEKIVKQKCGKTDSKIGIC